VVIVEPFHAAIITKACEALRLAPSTISAQSHNLEEQMGEKLLARSDRTLMPTEVGVDLGYYVHAVYRDRLVLFCA
jgi:DNA-binding transcriptional LysR family regulator